MSRFIWQFTIPLLTAVAYGPGLIVLVLRAATARPYPGGSGIRLANNFAFLAEPEYSCSILTSYLLAVAVAVVSLLIACPAGWLLRTVLSRRIRLVFCLVVYSALLAGYYSRLAALRDLLSKPGPLDGPAAIVAGDLRGYSVYAEALGQLLWTLPLATIVIAFAFETCSDSMIAAARNLNGSFRRTLSWIGLPMTRNAQLAAFCLALAFSLSDDVANVQLNGNRRLTIAAIIDSFRKANDTHRVAAGAIFLVALQFPAVVVVKLLMPLFGPAAPRSGASP